MIEPLFIASKAAEALSFQTIITYYGLICLFCLPISLIVMILVYKKQPAVVKKLNTAVDKVFGDDKQEVKNAAESNDKSEQAVEKPLEDKTSDAENNEDYGLPVLSLFIGDKYKCVMSEKNRKDIGGTNFSWTVADKFIGSIEEMSGIFTAEHVGETYVESAVSNLPIYMVKVNPSRADWTMAATINDVVNFEDIVNVKVRMITSKIVEINEEERTIQYTVPNGNLLYEYGKDDAVRRALYIILDAEETRKDIVEGIEEYFMPVKDPQGAAVDDKYWIHKTYVDGSEAVDFVAFMKKGKSGFLYFGISECWRYGSSEGEVAGNTLMVDRSFKKLIAEEDYPASIGKDLKAEMTAEEADGRKEIEEANAAGKQLPVENNDSSDNENTSGPDDTENASEEPEEAAITTPSENEEQDIEMDTHFNDGGEDNVDFIEQPELDSEFSDPMSTRYGDEESYENQPDGFANEDSFTDQKENQ